MHNIKIRQAIKILKIEYFKFMPAILQSALCFSGNEAEKGLHGGSKIMVLSTQSAMKWTLQECVIS
jgi:hypothetical protein